MAMTGLVSSRLVLRASFKEPGEMISIREAILLSQTLCNHSNEAHR